MRERLAPPRVGMRMVKTAVAVFLCFAIDAFRGGGIPFYSAIAAVLCLQPSWQGSTQKARERTVATFLGGLAGMLVLAAERSWFPTIPALGWYALVAACLIPLLSLTVVLSRLAGVPLTAPLVVLGGAAVCTQTGDDFLWSAPLTPEGERAARSLLDGVGAAGFCYFLDREGLQISYGPSLRPGEEELRRATRALPHRHYRFSPGGARGEGAVLGWLALLPEKQAEAVRQGAAGEVRADDYPSGEPGERWVWLHSPAAGYGPALDEVVRRLGSPAPASFWPPDGLTGERAVRALEKRAFGGR